MGILDDGRREVGHKGGMEIGISGRYCAVPG